jgi:hypothetical protein
MVEATAKDGDSSWTMDTDTWPSQPVKVFDTLKEAMEAVGAGYGAELLRVTSEDLEKLKSGGIMAWDDGEYSHYIVLEKK